VQDVSGRPFADYMSERILDPVGMAQRHPGAMAGACDPNSGSTTRRGGARTPTNRQLGSWQPWTLRFAAGYGEDSQHTRRKANVCRDVRAARARGRGPTSVGLVWLWSSLAVEQRLTPYSIEMFHAMRDVLAGFEMS